MCCFCDDGPIEGDPYGTNPNQFKTGLFDAPCADPQCCLIACLCPPCTQFELRRKVLNYDMTKYTCCQGYANMCCFKAGQCGESSCPEVCLCCEVLCFPCLSISATRMYVMDYKNLQSDPCDRRLIRCNNCLQIVACICNILAIFFAQLRELAQLLRCVADITYCTISSCMAAQVNFEIKDGSMGAPAPMKQVMTDGQTVVVVQQGQPVQGQPVYVQQPQQGYPQQGQGYPAPNYQTKGEQPPAYGQTVYVQQQPQPGTQYMR